MKLISEWRRVAAFSLSYWLQVVAILVMVIPELRFYFTGKDYDPHLAWWLGLLLLVASLAGRLVQQGVSWWREWLRIIGFIAVVIALAMLATKASAAQTSSSPASERAALEIAVPYIMKKEGIRLVAYRDIVGVWTICGGITSASGIKVYRGMTMSLEQCKALMRQKVAEYRNKLHRYFTSTTINTRLPATRDTAYTSLAYNVGVPTIGRSTAVRRLNAGDIRGGCEAITWFDKAGHRVIRGLFERRKEEKGYCLIGV